MPAELGVDDPEISPDGTQVALTQTDGGETSEVWVAHSITGYFDNAEFDLVSYGVSGTPVGGPGANSPSMSSTGRYVAFTSYQSTELSGGTVPFAYPQTWMRSRTVQLTITPSVNFGTVDVGGQSAPQTVTLTNSSLAEVTIASVTVPAGPFSITVNNCPSLLPAGASCTVTMVFRPTAVGAASSTLTVSGDGLTVTTSLTGTGRTPTGPTPGFLTVKPISANYGSGPIGTAFAAKTFTVSNPGQTSVSITSVTIGGGGADQFAITSNGCTGTLAPAATCKVLVSATVTRDGSFSATLDISGSGGASAHATLRIGGQFTPILKMNPGVASPGEVTAAVGSEFPPNIDVQLAFDGELPFATVHTDASGAFRFDVVLLSHGVRIGGRQIVVIDRPEFSGVFAPLLIELATSRPSGFNAPLFTSGVRALITRGG
jgi:hypothetical protein